MKEGDIGLAVLPQDDGQVKLRPILLLKKTSSFGDFIVCGISTTIRHQQIGLDEVLVPDEENHLKQISLIRLTYLHTISLKYISGTIGKIPKSLHAELLERLAAFFEPTV